MNRIYPIGGTMPNGNLQEILTQAVEAVKTKDGKVNLAEIARLTGISRQRLRTLSKRDFVIDHSLEEGYRKPTKITGYESIVDTFLRKGVTNSNVIFDNARRQGYKGGLTTVKRYIMSHKDLVPASRILAAETSNRGRRYETEPGEMFQMDWGFVRVTDGFGGEWQCACFAMVCHHCGLRYIEFFPSARQENLFIGMLHAFSVMGVPKKVYTDNMKSVVVKRLMDGTPVWNKDYEAFQKLVGFKTSLHKVAHPWSKGRWRD